MKKQFAVLFIIIVISFFIFAPAVKADVAFDHDIKALETKHEAKFQDAWHLKNYGFLSVLFNSDSGNKAIHAHYYVSATMGQKHEPYLKEEAMGLINQANGDLKELADRHGFAVEYSVYFPIGIIEGVIHALPIPPHFQKTI